MHYLKFQIPTAYGLINCFEGLKSAQNLPDKIGEQLEDFLKDEMPDDHRIAPKPKDKRKSKKLKQLERAKRKKKLLNEVLAEENNNKVVQGD